jgi:hypothetical protein
MSTQKTITSPKKRRQILRDYLVGGEMYAVLVGTYAFCALHYLGGWLRGLFDHHREWYAVVALGLILAQGLLLETVTQFFLKLAQRNKG